ncbi:hypothetical protein SAMN05216370_2501 [Pseudomonas peli]|uniref:DUF3592 domain-containing protein n=1 Tax=Pseudomonas peli TaxID=592361 RepID=A0AB37Z8S6_9PSED|nr:hypothetical protein [Pseudomonas peli]NMZ70093.1 hypothetical protein [Pseudomonas peli]SCW65392.1 hypothetical protein SAMN05216370_2501 [Pseudomonas peli]
MEYISVAIKAMVTVFLTLVINKFLSIFRRRQLYVTVHSVINNLSYKAGGYTVSLVVGNKGKDKEKAVEIVFPKNKVCKVVSSDYSGVTSDGRKIKIDRVLAGQRIETIVYVSGEFEPGRKNKPFVKSEDANGKSFYGRGMEPVGAGPIFLFFSVFGAILSMGYFVYDGKSPFDGYYSLRYWSFYNAGFSVDDIQENKFLSGLYPFDKDLPISFLRVEKAKGNRYLHFSIQNRTPEVLKVSAEYMTRDSRLYVRERLAAYNIFDEKESDAELRRIDEKYNALDWDERRWGPIYLKAGETKGIKMPRPIRGSDSIEDFAVEFRVTGERRGLDEKYRFHPEESKEAREDIVRSLR